MAYFLLQGCAPQPDKCDNTGILGGSLCRTELLKAYSQVVLHAAACACDSPFSDNVVNESWESPSSFPIALAGAGLAILVEMEESPTLTSPIGDTVFYDSLIKDPYYPERPAKPYHFIVIFQGDTLKAEGKRAWIIKTADKPLPDDSGPTGGFRREFKFQLQWNADIITGRIKYTARHILN